MSDITSTVDHVAIAVAALGAMATMIQGWFAKKQRARVEEKVDVVHAQTNSMHLETLRSLALLARRLAVNTNETSDLMAAEKAEADVKSVEAQSLPPPANKL